MGERCRQSHPADTSRVRLPADLMDLAEELARNTHEVWVEGWMKDGWTYGPERDDAAKKHPRRVPYEALSESEKDYDRRILLETLRLMVSLGYSIRRC